MSTTGGLQELPSSSAGDTSNDTKEIWSHPVSVIPNGNSLEDGEIVEGRFAGISSQPAQQPKGHLQLRSHVQVGTSTLPTVPPSGLAATVEPMSKEDLDRAKSLVLDLLGWGVTPEYLVEYGLSPGAVLKIFTDLRLRLPSNLHLPNNLEVLSSTPPHHGA